MKLHVACGDVYLKDYVNIDIKGTLIKEGGDNFNLTVLSNYYKREFSSVHGKKREIIIDLAMNILKPWDFTSESADEIVMISTIEHFTKEEAKFILQEAYRVLKLGERLVIDFPDIKKDVEEYYVKDPEFLIELIYCNQKDEYSIHHWGYTPWTFTELAMEIGYSKANEGIIVKHNYPMIGFILIK